MCIRDRTERSPSGTEEQPDGSPAVHSGILSSQTAATVVERNFGSRAELSGSISGAGRKFRSGTRMNDKLRAAIGRRIAQMRDQRGLTLIQVADAAKCDEATVRNAIAGRPLRQKSLAAICRALDIDLADFALGEAGELTQRIYGYERRNEVRHYEGFYLLLS